MDSCARRLQGRSLAVGNILGLWGQMRISFICAHSIALCPSSRALDLTHLPNLCMKKSNSCTSTLSLELSLPGLERGCQVGPRGPSRGLGDLSLPKVFLRRSELGSWWERNTGKSERKQAEERKLSQRKVADFVSDQSRLTKAFRTQGLVPPRTLPACLPSLSEDTDINLNECPCSCWQLFPTWMELMDWWLWFPPPQISLMWSRVVGTTFTRGHTFS